MLTATRFPRHGLGVPHRVPKGIYVQLPDGSMPGLPLPVNNPPPSPLAPDSPLSPPAVFGPAGGVSTSTTPSNTPVATEPTIEIIETPVATEPTIEIIETTQPSDGGVAPYAVAPRPKWPWIVGGVIAVLGAGALAFSHR